jgi:hypothetical protein
VKEGGCEKISGSERFVDDRNSGRITETAAHYEIAFLDCHGILSDSQTLGLL